MISIPQILSVCLFEFRRSLTFGRILAFAILSLFPPAMVLLISQVSALTEYKPLIMFLTYIVLILALLLWATPNVYSELESRNWLFLTSRPRGRVSLLLGKYLAAGLSSFIVCSVAITLSVMIVGMTQVRFRPDILKELAAFYPKLTLISLVACFEYAAVFSLIGVLFQRRAMVIATIYALGFELLFAFIPALITKFSVRYHLVGISFAWMGWFLPGNKPPDELIEIWITNLPVWVNILVLALIPLLVCAIAIYVIRNREYLTVEEV